MANDLRALRALSPADRRSLGLAWLYLLIAYLALRVLPLPRVGRLLSRLSVPGRTHLPPERLAYLLDVAARRHLRPMTCLPRSLALQALLRCKGIRAELRIGVRREEGSIQAHAWLEHAGQPVGDPAGVNRVYRPLLGALAV